MIWRCVLIITGLVAVGCASGTSGSGDGTSGSAGSTIVSEAADRLFTIRPDDDATAVVERADPGAHFQFEPGIHRGVSLVPRDGDRFSAAEGAVLSGAVVLEEFVADERGWVAQVDVEPLESYGRCRDGTERCGLPEEVWVDGAPIERVAEVTELSPDSWWFDPAGPSVVLGFDPGGQLVELSSTTNAFRGSADDVELVGLTVEHYAGRAQAGVIHMEDGAEGWLITDCRIADSQGVAVVLGSRSTLRGCSIEGMGQQGVGGWGADALVEENLLARNNRLGYDQGWSAGGAKFARTDGLVVRGNTVVENDGAGLWTDIDARDTTYEANRVEGNTGAGIFHEISYAAVIRGNQVTGNGSDSPGWVWGAGIQVAGSAGVTVVDNVVDGNLNGIVGVEQDRGEGEFGEYRLVDLVVRDNVVRNSGQTGIAQDRGDVDVYERGHVFEGNRYEGDSSWGWLDEERTFEEWQRFGHDLSTSADSGG